MKVRILTMNPNSIFLAQRDKDENEVPGQIKYTILNLESWINNLKKLGPNSDNVTIKYYNTLPLNFYFRQDEYLYVGPYLYGLTSQQTISYEFKIGSYGYDYWTKYFDSLWENDSFAKNNYKEFVTENVYENVESKEK